ncbi:MlaD family protein [Desulfobacula toluolica]|uniref:Conserved uncharacterized protein n=1 Tax=Desulfobacula toluolica (strain DSM 7467 / Tol2) TaxID=651182 RepID=K0NE48_DESTT|nr:MlaD family protein [Desulfobacula toluolica]CCK79080.1 conserved uncharacterized protein, precursor [Desulfobacula toluolica Tol2]
MTLTLKSTIFGLLASLFFLSACTGLTLSVQFKQIDGLKQNDPVIFNSTTIGKVKTISYTKDADFLVSIQIQKEFSHAATEDTQFYIDVSPLSSNSKSESKAVFLEQNNPGGKKLDPGTIVQGTSKRTLIPYAKALESLGQTLENAFSKMLTDIEKIPESDQYKNLKKKLSELKTRLESSSKEMQENIRNDILPKLEEKFKEIIKSLEQQGQNDKARELEKDFGKLQEI